MPHGPVHFASESVLAIAAMIGAAAVIIAVLRRIHLRKLAWLLLSAGIFLLVLSAGQPYWLSAAIKQVAVMVDSSVSTRGASFRDPEMLKRRIAELLGDTPYQIVSFEDRFAPPPADAIVLFSGGRFEPPSASPPIYPVLDPTLEAATDAAITRMELRGDRLYLSASNNGPPRTLTIHGVLGPANETVEADQTFVRTIDPSAQTIWAELSGGDPWPENDRGSIRRIEPINLERWWVGHVWLDNFRALTPEQLPSEAADYLSCGLIVLYNLPADEISPAAQDRLQEYVRDLGGSILIIGGDSAFGCGGYDGTVLDALSPLASSAPKPENLWVVLADASGSMSQDNRWDQVTRAVVRLLPNLPASDPVRVGQFSDTLRWWSDGRSAGETAKLPFPPPDALPHGPTNLQPVLEAIARDAPRGMPTQLLLLTDAETQIDDPAAMTERLKAADIKLHLMAIERGEGLPVLQDIVRDTGGVYLTETDPAQWPASVRHLLAAALPDRLGLTPVDVKFLGPAAAIPGGKSAPWNRTWLKPGAAEWAEGNSLPMAASWRFGLGQVVSLGFTPSAGQVGAIARAIAQPPGDPRLKVSWRAGPMLNVSVDAVDGKHYLNDLDLSLEIRADGSGSPIRTAIPQTGPGQYELTVPSLQSPGISTVWMGNRVIDRIALAGWYAPIFAAVGEDRAALEALANQTGGTVIPPSQKTPIQFDWPKERYDLTSWFAAGAALFLAAGLLLAVKPLAAE